MRLFLDANVLVSVLNKEYPLFSYSSRVLSLADHKNFKLYSSPVCLAIAFYFSEKKSGNAMAKKKMEFLCNKLEVSIADKNVVQHAIQNKRVHDFEDGIEYYSALASGSDCIITEDIGDFYFSEIEVLTSEGFLRKYCS